MKISVKYILLALLLLAAVSAAFCFHRVFTSSNVVNNKVIVVVNPNSSFDDLMDTLRKKKVLKSESTFRTASKLLKFRNVRTGRYDISACRSNLDLVRLLRRGQHYPVKFTFNNIRTKAQFVEKVGNKFFFRSGDLEKLLDDNGFLSAYNLNDTTAVALFIPNTYEIYYDITAEDFIDFMHRQYEKFWDAERMELARNAGLSQVDVATLASIVEEENSKPSEKAVIAGLYINRLHKGMLLQSDPTVKFAVGDFSRQRILAADLKTDSPYNTYLYPGLPPGPIRIPEASTMDSVLHYRHHDYLYMCAKEDFSGYHNFTGSAAVHMQNAAKYRAALNKRKIMR